MKKCVSLFFLCVKITIFGLCGRGGFVPRPKPAQNAARLAFQSVSVTLPTCTGCWVQNPIRCKEVVSLSHDKFSLNVSISNSLTSHIKKGEIQLLQSWLSSRLQRPNGSKFYFTS